MKASLTKSFSFEAAHYLPMATENHKCRRIHGHSFRCDVEITGEVDEKTGWITDFMEIKKILEPVRLQLDHHFLNQDIPELSNPTSENICRWIWQKLKSQLPELTAVTIRETCTSACTYRGE
jgi:6-pyruvoyl tetrahydropterin synthase/QueD family protein